MTEGAHFMLLPVLDVARQILQGINPDSALRNLKMEVRSGGISCRAGDTQHLTLLHLLSSADQALAHMGIERRISASVADYYIFTIGSAALGNNDRTRLGRQHLCGVAHTANVHALVVR